MTDEPFNRYFIRSGWRGYAEMPRAIGAKFFETLKILSSTDPIFAVWKTIGLRKTSLLGSKAVKVTEHNIDRNDLGQPSRECEYHASASAGKFKDPRYVTFTIDAGGECIGRTSLEFGAYNVAPDLEVVTYPLFKTALLAINAIWCAPWACAQAFRCGSVKVPINIGGVPAFRIDGVPQVPGQPTFPHSIFHIPWIAYLSAELAAGLTLAPEILTERTPDGGLLMSATTERLDPTNPLHTKRARILAETLIACSGHHSP